MQFRLSLAMIVRDEEGRLARALESVQKLVDEIVVVDTGSRDGTVAIAEGFGARVLHHPWADDFAEARNVSLSACRGEWILQLDADEVLPAVAHDLIREATLREEVAGYFLRQRNHVPGGCHAIRALRLWRREPEARFVYPIHEQILPGVAAAARRTGRTVETLAVGIEHYGYVQGPEIVADKLARNVRLMERWLRLHPEDLYLRYVLGGTLAQLGRDEESLAAYGRAFRQFRALSADHARGLECGPNLCALYAQALLADGDVRGARSVVSYGRALFPQAAEPLFVDGAVAREEGDLARAIRCFGACADLGKREEPLHVDEGVTGAKALLALGECWEAAGAPPRAREAYERAAAAEPESFAPVHRLARVAAHQGDTDRAIAAYEAFLRARPEEPLAWLHGAVIFLDEGCAAEADRWLREAERLARDDLRVRGQRARLALIQGDLRSALDAGSLSDAEGAAAALIAAGLLGAPLPETSAAPTAVARALLGRVRDLTAAGRPDLVERWLRDGARLEREAAEIARAFRDGLQERAQLTPEGRAA